LKDIRLGPANNSVARVLGRRFCGWLLRVIGVGAIINNILGSAIGGRILIAIVG
jgi:hypothetical protein